MNITVTPHTLYMSIQVQSTAIGISPVEHISILSTFECLLLSQIVHIA